MGRRVSLSASSSAMARNNPGVAIVFGLLQRPRGFTNWWHRYVDGRNPDNPHAAAVSAFLREEGIDPYLLPRDEIEDLRKKYLTQVRWFAKDEESQEAWSLLREKKS